MSIKSRLELDLMVLVLHQKPVKIIKDFRFVKKKLHFVAPVKLRNRFWIIFFIIQIAVTGMVVIEN